MADKFFDAMFTASVIGGSSGPAPVIVAKNITANGTYSAVDDQVDGFNPVIVSVPNTYTASDEGKVVSGGALVAQTATTYTTNDVYDTTLINSVTVNVPTTKIIKFTPVSATVVSSNVYAILLDDAIWILGSFYTDSSGNKRFNASEPLGNLANFAATSIYIKTVTNRSDTGVRVNENSVDTSTTQITLGSQTASSDTEELVIGKIPLS